MRFYPYYIYEKNEAGNLCNVSLSIQSFLTQSGRVCFAVLADCKNMNGEVASYTSAYLVKELTKWFYRILLDFYAVTDDKNKQEVFDSFKE